MTDNSKWVACWGNATSITNRREAIFAKDLTLRYPIRMCFSGTLLPIYGWRTYNEERDAMRQTFNEWLRTSPIFDGCIDFDAAVRSVTNPKAFADGFDSGDHLHPSERAYEAMAQAAIHKLIRRMPRYDHEELF